MAQVPKAPLNAPSAGTVQGSFAQRSESLPQNAFGAESSATRANIELAIGGVRATQAAIDRDNAQSLAEAGRGMMQAGGAIVSAGQDLQRQYLADRALQNETEALNTSTDFARRTNELQSAYMNLQGTAATGGYEAFQTQVRDLETSTLEGITDPQARRMAAARIQGQTTQVLAGADRYRQQQVRVANATARESAVALSINEGVINRFNEPGMIRALNQGMSEINALGETAGWDDDTLRMQQARYRGRFFSSVIASLAENGTDAGVTAANNLFTRVRGGMDAESAVRMENALSGPVRRADANGRVITATEGALPAESPAAYFSGAAISNNQRNNPLNIIDGDFAKGQPGYTGGRGRFAAFSTPEEGAAAADALLRSYARRGLDTPAAIVNRWAPRGDGNNDPIAYAATISRAMGITPTTQIDMNDPAKRRQLIEAMSVVENGAARNNVRRDRGQMLEEALRGTEDNPQLRSEVISQFSSRMNVIDTMQAQERAQMERRVRDINAALSAGSTATIPEQDIRRLFQPAQADVMLDQLYTNQIAGQVFTSMALATPAQVAELQNDLITGTGSVSAELRARRGITVIDGVVDEADRGADISARNALRQVVEQRLAARAESIRSDPAQYAQIDPDVRTASDMLRAAGQNATPEMRERLATAQRAAQTRLGVLETNQRVLPKAQSEAIVSTLLRADPETTNVGAQMQQLQRAYGSAWPAALNDLVRDGRLPREYYVMANIPSAVGQTDFQRMITAAREVGGMDDLAKRLGPQRTQVETAVAAQMQSFNGTATASGASGGDVLATDVTQAATNLAYYYALQGRTPETAAADAVSRIINDKYDISGTIRVPRGMLSAVTRAQAQVMSELRPEQLPDRGGNPDLLPDERRAIDFQAAQRGFWVTNQRDNGIVLMMQLENGGRIPVRREDGTRVELIFNNLPQPVIPGAAEPQRDSPARAVQRIEGFDAPQGTPPARQPQGPGLTPQLPPTDAPQPRRPPRGRNSREPSQ